LCIKKEKAKSIKLDYAKRRVKKREREGERESERKEERGREIM
jgi:hypothetical protein